MRFFKRLAQRRRNDVRHADDAPYVCTLCGAGYENRAIVVCPECRGFVVAREE